MLSILFKSHLIIHSSTGRAFKDTQRALGRHSGTRAPKALGHSDTWALEALYLADSDFFLTVFTMFLLFALMPPWTGSSCQLREILFLQFYFDLFGLLSFGF